MGNIRLNTREAAKQEFMPLMRELVRAYQAFAQYDAAGYQGTGLTVSQADVIFTLGNTEGMTCKEIGEKTLITKGTLTGVLDRLEKKSLVERRPCVLDRRCIRIHLTPEGEEVFEREFPRQIQHMKERFDRIDRKQQEQARESLALLKSVFDGNSG